MEILLVVLIECVTTSIYAKIHTAGNITAVWASDGKNCAGKLKNEYRQTNSAKAQDSTTVYSEAKYAKAKDSMTVYSEAIYRQPFWWTT